MQFGVNLGRRLDPILPRAYFQTRYSYGIVPRTLGIRPNRSRLESELGYFVTKRLSLSAIEMLQISHSGLDFPQDFPSRTDERWRHHDQISRISLLNVGIGGAFAVTKSVEFFTSALTNVWGQNGHSLNRALTFGVNWNFRTRRFVRQAFAGEGNAGGSCAVLCRKCERLFQPPDSVTPALTASLTSGR